MNVGDWVYSNQAGKQTVGFILTINEINWFAEIFDLTTAKPSGKGLSNVIAIPPDVTAEDLHTLIDLALDTDDRDWFQALSGRLLEINQRGAAHATQTTETMQ